jgi:alkanesulfonate monooxygenase SsuD/methylene tetrahydromethanopterin reductase-like flavin-dependent oxidoreductase (luciferase family)
MVRRLLEDTVIPRAMPLRLGRKMGRREDPTMRFAIWDNTNPRVGVSHGELYRQHLDEVVIAEELGFDHFWLYEHHVSSHVPMPSPNLMIAAAARETSRIRLGTMINVLPYRHPLIVAEEAAMLDQMTNGRLDVGIGRGGIKPEEWAALGVKQERSRDIFREAYELLLRIWADEDFVHEGEFFRIDKHAPLSPPLVQKPHPPLYIGAQSPESLRWAAERDLPFGQIDALIPDCRRDSAIYRAAQVASGHAPEPRLFLTLPVHVAATDAEAREAVYPYLVQYGAKWDKYVDLVQAGRFRDDEMVRQRAPILQAMSFDDLIERGPALVGSPETIIRKIQAYRAALEIAVLVSVFSIGSMPQEMVTQSLRLFARHVMPYVRGPEPVRVPAPEPSMAK